MSKPERDKRPSTSPIEAYLDRNNLTQEQFAKQIGVSQGLVWQWIERWHNPKKGTRITAERAKEIEEKTRGEITRSDLRPDIYPPAQRVAA
jgi:DNA-binding transcriptional regulator YdaS (Cro superfamily)